MKSVRLVLPALVIISLISCAKSASKQEEEANEITCSNIQNITLTSNSPVKIGGTINFSAPEVGGYRIYTWKGPKNFNSQYPDNTISSAKLENEGWYHVNISNPTCGSRSDSVYIDVQLEQGTPACTIANNTCEFNNQANDTYTSAKKGIDASSGLLSLETSGGSTLEVYFHHRWKTAEPEDGIYSTINVPVFDQFDYNYNKVHVSTIKNSINFKSYESQKVYVSHVSGKLQIRFCALEMGGTNGQNSFVTRASGTVTEK